MASLGELFQGTPPTYGVNVVGGGKSPLFDFAKVFGNYLKGLIGQPLPSYPGQIDPGMSPTMAGLGQMLQAYSQSPLPQVMGQAGGVLGRFMNPSFANPMARVPFGFPNYFGGGGMTGGIGVDGAPPMSPPTQAPGFPGMPFPGTPPPPPTATPTMGPPPPMGEMPYGNDMRPQQIPFDLMRNMTGTPDFGAPTPPPPSGMRNTTGGPYIGPPTDPMQNAYMPKKPGQMTRAEWIAAGLKPGTKGGGGIKNAAMPVTRGGHTKLRGRKYSVPK